MFYRWIDRYGGDVFFVEFFLPSLLMLYLIKAMAFLLLLCSLEVSIYESQKRFYCILLPVVFTLLLCCSLNNGDIYHTACFPVLYFTHTSSLSLRITAPSQHCTLSIFYFLQISQTNPNLIYFLHHTAGFATTLIIIPPK